jgi:hypothetical protein
MAECHSDKIKDWQRGAESCKIAERQRGKMAERQRGKMAVWQGAGYLIYSRWDPEHLSVWIDEDVTLVAHLVVAVSAANVKAIPSSYCVYGQQLEM